MKVVASDQKKVEEVKYPKLKIHDSGMIVLFTAWQVGTVLVEGEYPLGSHCSTWSEDQFKNYTGEIKLSNN